MCRGFAVQGIARFAESRHVFGWTWPWASLVRPIAAAAIAAVPAHRAPHAGRHVVGAFCRPHVSRAVRARVALARPDPADREIWRRLFNRTKCRTKSEFKLGRHRLRPESQLELQLQAALLQPQTVAHLRLSAPRPSRHSRAGPASRIRYIDARVPPRHSRTAVAVGGVRGSARSASISGAAAGSRRRLAVAPRAARTAGTVAGDRHHAERHHPTRWSALSR